MQQAQVKLIAYYYKLLLDLGNDPVLQNYTITILIIIMRSDCSGNNTGNFQRNFLAVDHKAYSELLPVLPFYVAIYVANMRYSYYKQATQDDEL